MPRLPRGRADERVRLIAQPVRISIWAIAGAWLGRRLIRLLILVATTPAALAAGCLHGPPSGPPDGGSDVGGLPGSPTRDDDRTVTASDCTVFWGGLAFVGLTRTSVRREGIETPTR